MLSIIPIAKEKALQVSALNKYMFSVPMNANKDQIAKNVAEQFNVTVTGVTVLIRKGKPKRFSRGKRRYPGTTYGQDMKIAYVTLKEGDKIKVFDEEPVQEEAKPNVKDEPKKAETSMKVEKKPLLARRRTGNRGDK